MLTTMTKEHDAPINLYLFPTFSPSTQTAAATIRSFPHRYQPYWTHTRAQRKDTSTPRGTIVICASINTLTWRMKLSHSQWRQKESFYLHECWHVSLSNHSDRRHWKLCMQRKYTCFKKNYAAALTLLFACTRPEKACVCVRACVFYCRCCCFCVVDIFSVS